MESIAWMKETKPNMSEKGSRNLIPDSDCLEGIIKHVPERRLEAAKQLWEAGSVLFGCHIESCQVLVKHVPQYAERAAERLLTLDPEPCSLDCIFENITNLDIRKRAGEYILKVNRERKQTVRCAKLILEVPECADCALQQLLDIGAQDVYDLRVIWHTVTDSEILEEQWQRFVPKTMGGVRNRIYDVLKDETLGLYDKAWEVFEQLAESDNGSYFSFLAYPHLRDRAWSNIRRFLDVDWQKLSDIIIRYELDLEDVWAYLGKMPQIAKHHVLERLVSNTKFSVPFQEKIKTIFFSEDPMPECWLRGVLYLPAYRDEAARRLLAMEFEPYE